MSLVSVGIVLAGMTLAGDSVAEGASGLAVAAAGTVDGTDVGPGVGTVDGTDVGADVGTGVGTVDGTYVGSDVGADVYLTAGVPRRSWPWHGCGGWPE